MTNFKIGVVGFGYWGKNQARVFKELASPKTPIVSYLLSNTFSNLVKKFNFLLGWYLASKLKII